MLNLVSAAWYGVAFDRQNKLPELATIIEELSGKPRRRKTPEELADIAKGITSFFGGTIHHS